MRYIVGIICLITSLLLCACSEDDEKGAERYSGVFLSMEAIDAITPEDSFSDVSDNDQSSFQLNRLLN